MAIILRCLTERSELIDWFVPGRTGARAVDRQTRLEHELAISHFELDSSEVTQFSRLRYETLRALQEGEIALVLLMWNKAYVLACSQCGEVECRSSRDRVIIAFTSALIKTIPQLVYHCR